MASNKAKQVNQLDISKYPQFDRSLNGANLPTQLFVERLSKYFSYRVCSSGVDFENKNVWFENMINANITEHKTVTFADAAKYFGWKSFTFSEDRQIVIPKK